MMPSRNLFNYVINSARGRNLILNSIGRARARSGIKFFITIFNSRNLRPGMSGAALFQELKIIELSHVIIGKLRAGPDPEITEHKENIGICQKPPE